MADHDDPALLAKMLAQFQNKAKETKQKKTSVRNEYKRKLLEVPFVSE